MLSMIVCLIGFSLSAAWLYCNLRRAADTLHHEGRWASYPGLDERETAR